jgi:hypothetical protein
MTFDVRIDQKTLEKACELAIEEAVLNLQEKIIEITPRDPKRLPKNPNRAVTGNLKRSIKNKKNSALDYTI